MIKIGITGQPGFIGTHLYNTLGLFPDIYERIPFEDDYFMQEEKLKEFVSSCDVIVHLAAMNRHKDPDVLYKTNIHLVEQLIEACKVTKSTPHVLFSSSIQEAQDNIYGRSKKEGRRLLKHWAKESGSNFTGLIIPNVFGPFGHPFYNSVVATFCYQLTHGKTPEIHVDGEVKLIYINDLIKKILENIENVMKKGISGNIEDIIIPHDHEIKVSHLLEKLRSFKDKYLENGIFPDLADEFDHQLFNTFLCYIDHEKFYPFKLKSHRDERGSFVETVKLNSGGQVSFSTTVPGITRGNHFHIRKTERFAVLKGKARIEIRKIDSDKKISFDLDGATPAFVDMPVWYTHNITNTGKDELITLFWINEHFDPEDPDTFYEEV